MNHFYIARHGETLNNREKRLSGWIDTPLTDDGLKPTKVALAKLQGVPIDEIYSSDLGRAFVTAYIMGRQLGYPREIGRLSGLREVNYGEAANLVADKAYALFPELDRDTHFAPPGGESLKDMQARVISTIMEIDAAHDHASILIVAHSGTMAAICSSFTGHDLGHHNISEAYLHDFVAHQVEPIGRLVW
jgi:probable phosphoglycerate mutase